MPFSIVALLVLLLLLLPGIRIKTAGVKKSALSQNYCETKGKWRDDGEKVYLFSGR